ncbi:MAG: xylan 1,4-beta-xylosidase [Bacteroidota bacterium]|nr:xylan 1,4-beta-xylosidase [Bacteroidota bacterium]MDP4216696.1 xylan 1,4-beta-xylosidase [Bacteroidota bacterium]MDP4253604.1 xylan 1,4-beta-xylosidase [Bacteroidota bacterium]
MKWNRLVYGLLAGALTVTSVPGFAQKIPYQDPSLSPRDRAKDLVGRLTLDQKASLMLDESAAIPQLGIKKFNWWSEALHGLANNGNVTVFPEPIGMAASFDDSLLFHVFDAVSDEVRARYNDARRQGLENRRFLSLSVWTPNINIFRDPRWGRGQETYGEDPYLTSRMGISVVRGLQGPLDTKYRKLYACAKHYAVHSGPEPERHVMNLYLVDPRDLWETYLPAFKALVTKADVREVMCAYQRLDDEPCCGNNRLLQQILRDQWGFKYMVVSDCGAISDFWQSHKVSSDAIHAAAKGELAGTDVECGYNYAFKSLPAAVHKGLITEQEVDKHLMRTLEGRFELGEMDPDSLVSWSKIPMSVVNSPEHQQLALDMARESMTLLQNRGGILPLAKGVRKIAVLGPNADAEPVLWGNYNGTPVHTVTILQGLKAKLPKANMIYDRACDLTDQVSIESVIGQTTADGKPGIKATYWNNRTMEGKPIVTDQITSPLILTTAGQHQFAAGVPLEGFSAKYETVYKATKSGQLVIRVEGTGRNELKVNGVSLKRFGSWRANPNRIAVPVEEGKEYRIEVTYSQQQNWGANLKLDFGWEVPVSFDALIKKLKDVDLVVFAGGISSRLEGEEMPIDLPGFKGGDRTDIELPLVQRNCLKALKEAGKKVIFVDCSGSAMGLVPETETCDAILQAWYPGEKGGEAVGDVLLGDYNPSGKLPVSFYKNIAQLPGFEDYSMKGRTYRFMSDPLFPFGFGLSYTTFAIGDAQLSGPQMPSNGSVTLTVPVSNTGKRKGTEVLQVYIRKTGDTAGPLKTLRNFRRVTLSPGDRDQVAVTLNADAFQFFDRNTGTMMTSPGEYELFYGNSSADKDLKSIKVTIR